MPKHCSLTLLDKSFVEASLTFDTSFETTLSDQCGIAVAANANEAVANGDFVITAMPGDGPLFDSTQSSQEHT